MKFRQVLLRAVLAAAAGTLVFAGPTLGVREAKPGSHGNLRDFVRSGAISKPTAAQRAAVRALHAKATWNSHGTPSTLMRPGGFLTKRATGATAVAAARGWLAKHRALFRLSSVNGLRLVADSRLSSSARTPAPTGYGPFLTSQAPSIAGTLPLKLFVTGAAGATSLSPK